MFLGEVIIHFWLSREGLDWSGVNLQLRYTTLNLLSKALPSLHLTLLETPETHTHAPSSQS